MSNRSEKHDAQTATIQQPQTTLLPMPNPLTRIKRTTIRTGVSRHLQNRTKKTQSKWASVLLLILSFVMPLIMLSGCATTSSPEAKDPFEKANRAVLKFNLSSDRWILKPIAKTYARVVPSPLRTGVSNFFSNLWQPMTVLNDLLQGKLGHAGRDSSRFLLNTTLGIFGIFDVASRLKLPEHREDFGQTLAVWGVPSGPYLVLPFFGPSNLRASSGLIPQTVYADVVSYVDSPQIYYVQILRMIAAREQLLGVGDILDLQPDQYLFIRESYRQQRLNLIYDGKPPLLESDAEDDLINQLLEED